jgi:ADP-ribose pyrophosphatase YjhB (NUDIX family)
MVVDPDGLPSTRAEFTRMLSESVARWRVEGAPLVWLELPITHAALVKAAVDAGFTYHHATSDALHLTLLLIPDAHVPGDATHFVGAGGVVLTDDERLLVVTEKHHRKKHYKLPGGALLHGEHIQDAVVREVLEGTGVNTRFLSLACFRHWHGYRHGKSDIYFVARLEPLTFALRPDPSEIDECLWMPVHDYLQSELTHPFNRRIVEAAMQSGAHGGADGACGPLRPESIDGYGTPETHELFFPEPASTPR